MQHGELVVGVETLAKLGQVSISTLKRSLKRIGRSEPKLATQRPKRPQE